MTAQLLSGKTLAAKIRENLAAEIDHYRQQGKRPPGLAVILVGEDPASTIYVRNKRQACEEVGIHSYYYPMQSDVSESALMKLVSELNHDRKIDGILIQLPLPGSIDTNTVLDAIDPNKDVDGFHPYNLGKLAQKRPFLRPCTPYGIIQLLNSINEPYKNRHAVVIGASNIVGRPMFLELLLAGATVTLCHKLTADLSYYVTQADILVSAVGKPGLIKGAWIKEGATVIDVGINRLANGSLVGDIEFDSASQRAGFITPVPGGVGPMTVATLLSNTFFAYTQLVEA